MEFKINQDEDPQAKDEGKDGDNPDDDS